MKPRTTASAAAFALTLAGLAQADPTMPNEFESPAVLLDPLFSYFSGVASYTVSQSSQTVYEGSSMQLDIQFQPTSFGVSGVGVGTLGIPASSLSVDPLADTFSLTVEAPQSGTLSVYVTIREDDNADGIIDLGNGDDEWESPNFLLAPGLDIYNIPVSDFVDSGAGSGNGQIDFTTTGAMAYFLTFESRTSYPGGIITEPKTLLIDHVGLYEGPQELPSACDGDADGNGAVEIADISYIIFRLGDTGTPGALEGDVNADGVVDSSDVGYVIFRLGGC